MPKREVAISERGRKMSIDFAETIIKSANQYNRFHQNLDTQIERTYIGKIGECVFYNLLLQEGIKHDISDMFAIFDGQENADSFDFATKDGKTIDIKTASRPNHKRIMIPIAQFENMKKDIYVGIQLHFAFNGQTLIKKSIERATIWGYIDYETLAATPTSHFGEGHCKFCYLDQLKDIEELLKRFR